MTTLLILVGTAVAMKTAPMIAFKVGMVVITGTIMLLIIDEVNDVPEQ